MTWQPIETAPPDIDLLLGWWQCWPMPVWVQFVGWARASNTKPPGMSNGWSNGEATHWQPLPPPPDAEIP